MLNNDFSSIWETNLTPFGIESVDSKALKSFYDKAVSCGRLEALPKYDKEELEELLEKYEKICSKK